MLIKKLKEIARRLHITCASGACFPVWQNWLSSNLYLLLDWMRGRNWQDMRLIFSKNTNVKKFYFHKKMEQHWHWRHDNWNSLIMKNNAYILSTTRVQLPTYSSCLYISTELNHIVIISATSSICKYVAVVSREHPFFPCV